MCFCQQEQTIPGSNLKSQANSHSLLASKITLLPVSCIPLQRFPAAVFSSSCLLSTVFVPPAAFELTLHFFKLFFAFCSLTCVIEDCALHLQGKTVSPSRHAWTCIALLHVKLMDFASVIWDFSIVRTFQCLSLAKGHQVDRTSFSVSCIYSPASVLLSLILIIIHQVTCAPSDHFLQGFVSLELYYRANFIFLKPSNSRVSYEFFLLNRKVSQVCAVIQQILRSQPRLSPDQCC